MPQHSCVGILGEAISVPPSPDPCARAQGNERGDLDFPLPTDVLQRPQESLDESVERFVVYRNN
jgi:hypothetical protein